MKSKQRIIFIVFLSGLLFLLFPTKVEGQSYTKTFIVTGYYSPLPNQSVYVTGSYEGDIRLNGEGVHSADGSIVFPGMIAAPPDIPFGTKIEIPGIGIGEVHDRGGAIKGNRLDVWMGYGEEGLRRALWWGIREVSATILERDSPADLTVDLSKFPLAKDITLFVRTRYFRHDLTVGDEGSEIEELQRFLKKFGFLESNPTGFYGEETKRAILQFQLHENILGNGDFLGAGHFGPKTRVQFESKIQKKMNEMTLASVRLGEGDQNEEVKKVSSILVALNLIPHETDTFGKEFAEAVFQFQRSRGIVLREKDPGAKTVGPRTREHLLLAWKGYWMPDATKLNIPDRFRLNEKEHLLVFRNSLKFGDKNGDVTRLQEELRRLNLLRIEPTGFFGKTTEHAVFKFQQIFQIVDLKKDPGAGFVGPRTREKLNNLIIKREQQNRRVVLQTERKQKIAETREKESLLVASLDPSLVPESSLRELRYGETHPSVRNLQRVLQKLGYFRGPFVTDYFGDMTREALIQFQKQHGVIESEDDSETGRFGDRTKKALLLLKRV